MGPNPEAVGGLTERTIVRAVGHCGAGDPPEGLPFAVTCPLVHLIPVSARQGVPRDGEGLVGQGHAEILRRGYPAIVGAVRQAQLAKVIGGDRPQYRRDTARQAVAGKVQELQAIQGVDFQLAKLPRNRPGQPIVLQPESPDVFQVAEFSRDAPGELVAVQPQLRKVAQLPQFRRYLSGELVVV